MAELDRFGPALAAAMANVADMVTIMDPSGHLEYVNPHGVQLLGCTSLDELVGLSLVDLIHPDDLPRVLVAMTRMLAVDAEVPGRPAQLRIRRMDGTYIRVEANGAAGSASGEPMEHVVVTARPTIDADLHEQLMSLLTAGAPIERCLTLVPEIGAWRQPHLLHAVFALDDEGRPVAFGSEVLTDLGDIRDADAPWAGAARTGEELFTSTLALGGVAGERASERGVTYIRARPVVDALHRTHALVVMAHDVSSPLPGERSTLEFSWYALDKMAAVLEMALAWRCQAVELRRAAATDPLTGLANRAGFWARYEGASAVGGEVVSVLCIDLDLFKPVNDTFGHGVGDALLVEVADRLQRIVRPGDLVARLGGDEFALVLHELGEEQVAAVADRIIEDLCRPFEVDGNRVEIGASIGLAIGARSEDFDAAGLLAAADGALYEAKSAGRNRWTRAKAPA